ncbi:MAG: 2-phospho-L-lactate guanylyltransferase [Schumannella sp.]|nr:2-phospho-L-lactate guanylyltransferase [Schumannella sp.]
MAWTIVIPVKPSGVGKSRLARSPDVVRAIALDTIAAAVATDDVRVIVVTADAAVAGEAVALGAAVVLEGAPTGLRDAIDLGLSAVEGWRAVLLGDLPALRPADLAAALDAATGHRQAFVPDAEGTGSTLVTAATGSPFVHHFGASSASLHRAAGLAELAVPPESTLRRDVDLAEHLEAAARAGLGPRTRQALDGAR